MIYCNDCDFEFVGGNCSRVLRRHEFTGDFDISTLKNRELNNEGKCPQFKPKPKRGFFAKLLGK